MTTIPTTVHEAAGRITPWELDMCKKRKLNVTVNDYTYPSPNKAIQTNIIKLNNNVNSNRMQENITKNLAIKKCH